MAVVSASRVCFGLRTRHSFCAAYTQLAETRLYAFGAASVWPESAPFIAGRPDEKAIIKRRGNVLSLTVPIRTGVGQRNVAAQASRELAATERLGIALREIGRIKRTLHTLDWLEQPALRRQATAALNKGEFRNALARPSTSTGNIPASSTPISVTPQFRVTANRSRPSWTVRPSGDLQYGPESRLNRRAKVCPGAHLYGWLLTTDRSVHRAAVSAEGMTVSACTRLR